MEIVIVIGTSLLFLTGFNTAILAVLLLRPETKQAPTQLEPVTPKIPRPVTPKNVVDSGKEARQRIKVQLAEQMRRDFGELYEE